MSGEFAQNSYEHFVLCRHCSRKYDPERVASSAPRYCPADLLSKDPSRIRYAITSLFDDPQNNLTVFKNGSRTIPSQCPLSLQAALLRVLLEDPFLAKFADLLLTRWTLVVQGLVEQDALGDWQFDLREAVSLRDCSFIVRIGSLDLHSRGGHSIRIIDLDLKSVRKMKLYREEVYRMTKTIELFAPGTRDS